MICSLHILPLGDLFCTHTSPWWSILYTNSPWCSILYTYLPLVIYSLCDHTGWPILNTYLPCAFTSVWWAILYVCDHFYLVTYSVHLPPLGNFCFTVMNEICQILKSDIFMCFSSSSITVKSCCRTWNHETAIRIHSEFLWIPEVSLSFSGWGTETRLCVHNIRSYKRGKSKDVCIGPFTCHYDLFSFGNWKFVFSWVGNFIIRKQKYFHFRIKKYLFFIRGEYYC